MINIYTSLDEVPVDELPEGYEDGDNSVLREFPDGIPFERTPRQLYTSSLLSKNLVVPFTRELKLRKPNYMAGDDVFAVSRAYASAGVRKWSTRTKFFGEGMKSSTGEFQEKVGLKRDGVYGQETHKKLAKYFDEYGAFLMTKSKKLLSVADPRDTIIAYAIFGYNNRSSIHYTQGPSRMYGVKHNTRPPSIPYWEDCSSFSTWCYWGAKVRDPNGLGYNGYGYTGTLSQNGRKTYTPVKGDLAFYGYSWPYSHVVIYIGNGKCVSHGSEIGPVLIPVNYRPVSQYRTYI